MTTRLIDCVSATGVAAVVGFLGRKRGLTPCELVRPLPFLGGAAGALCVEFVFARWPDHTTRLWRRPLVRAASPAAIVVGTLLAGRRGGEAPFAATLGGLAGYFVLLFGIVSQILPEPTTWFEQAAAREDG